MTVSVTKNAINLRSELASLRNQGGYQEQQFYFDGLVTNGTFDADTDWTKGTGWTIAAGVADCDGTQTSNTDLSSTFVPTVGKSYAINYTISNYVSGTVRTRIGSVSANVATANGTFTDTITAVSVETFRFRANLDFVGSIDNVSVYETDGTDVIHTMPKGWVPKDVYEDGLLQREGAAHDYEVVYDGFDYFVKPTVAPSATTQTCVIGVKA
jgi:hypothetical protein